MQISKCVFNRSYDLLIISLLAKNIQFGCPELCSEIDNFPVL